MQKEDRTTPKKRKSTSSRSAFLFQWGVQLACLDDKETVILELARSSCGFLFCFVFLWVGGEMRDWEGLGFAMYKQKQRMFFESTLCCLTPLFNLVLIWFGFWVFVFIYISSYQVKLGSLDLVLVDCRKFCALFFIRLLCFFPLAHLFFPKSNLFFSPPKPPIFWNWPAGIPKTFSLLPVSFICVNGDCFLFQIQFHKRKTSTI